MAALISLMIIVVSIIYLQTFTMSAEEEAMNEAERSLNQIELNIQNNLDDAEAFLSDLFYKQEFSYFLNEKNELSDGEITYYISNLQTELINGRYLYNNMFGDIGVYSSNKQIKTSEWQFMLDTLKEKPYYDEIVDTKEDMVFGKVRNMDLISTTLKTNKMNMGDFGNDILPIYKKVYDLNTKEIVGVVEIDLDVARLADRTGLDYEIGEKGNLILDQEKQILFDTLQASETLRDELTKAIDGREGKKEISDGSHEYLAVYHSLDQTNLTTVSIIRQDEMQSFLKMRVIQICVISVLCLFLMLGIVYYFVHNMLKRLLVLDHMMEKVGGGDFEVTIDEDKIEDEVTRITRSFNEMASKLTVVMKEKVRYEQAQKEAELRALQAQINPHFLYNTLENMRMQCEIDEYYALGNSLSALGELFRYSISWGSAEVSFESEWMNLKNYISIMQMRYGDSVKFVLEKEEGLDDLVVPKLIMQPLMENSFHHGFKDKLPPWEIRVIARNEKDSLVIVIQDNGNGIPAERLGRLKKCLDANQPFRNEEKRKDSIGVTNVKQRIGLICRPGSTLTIESVEGEGTTITLVIVK